MKARRDGGWLRAGCRVGGLVLVLGALTAAKAHAQGSPGGFSADPFQPHTRQYSPYSRPMGPAGPAGGQGGFPVYRQGFVGANQFENYLQGLSSPGRNTTDRAGIGMPYYRSSVDPDWGPSRNRVYQPNAKSTPSFEESRRRLADHYFAYFTERDPRKRAALLGEYRQARRDAARLLSSGSLPASSRFEDESDTAADPRARAERADRGGTVRRGVSRGSAHPAPPVPLGRRSSLGARSTGGQRHVPSDTLRRAHEMDDDGPRTSARRPAPRGPSATHTPPAETPRD